MAEDLTKPYINYGHLIKRKPNHQPQPVKEEEPEGPEGCKNCIRKCHKPKVAESLMDYGCWCGPDTAPAKDIEGKIPRDRSQYENFVKEQGLPQPYDPVDRCCMVHDLDLGRARQTDKDAWFGSGSKKIAVINNRLANCFMLKKFHPDTKPWGRVFAHTAQPVFRTMAVGNLGGAGINAVTGSGGDAFMSSGSGFGEVGAGGASTGALYAFGA